MILKITIFYLLQDDYVYIYIHIHIHIYTHIHVLHVYYHWRLNVSCTDIRYHTIILLQPLSWQFYLWEPDTDDPAPDLMSQCRSIEVGENIKSHLVNWKVRPKPNMSKLIWGYLDILDICWSYIQLYPH